MTLEKRLPYSGMSFEYMRTGILIQGTRAENGRTPRGRLTREDFTEKDIRQLNQLVMQYGYGLAEVLRWVGEKFGPEVQFEAACVVDDVWMNGGNEPPVKEETDGPRDEARGDAG